MDDSVDLHALGKFWGRLIDGRYLEVRRHDDRVVWFDLERTMKAGRPITQAPDVEFSRITSAAVEIDEQMR